MTHPSSITRLVCLGDSFTEGLCDAPRDDGRPRGWADRLAGALALVEPAVDYANLAVRGKLLHQVVSDQVSALPDQLIDPTSTLVTFHAGANDVLRPRADLADLRSEYELAIRHLLSLDVTLMVFTVIPRAGGSGRTAARLAARFEAFNDGVHACVERYGLTLVDLGRLAALQDRRFWNDDRLHLSPGGHRRVAAAALAALGYRDGRVLGGPPNWWLQPLPPAPPRRRRDDAVDDLRWAARHLTPWVVRRLRGTSSGDGLAAKQPRPIVVTPEAI